jgi:uncharacterized membrane protein
MATRLLPDDVSTKTRAQERTDEIHSFRAELGRLERAGVLQLSREQRDRIDQHHDAVLAQLAADFDVDRDLRSKQLSLGMRVASFLGALALAASVFFLFYQFWGNFRTGTQVGILLAASLGSFALTLWIETRDRSGYFTKLSAMVAFACFVLNISMLGQIFSITPSDKALLPWAAYALLFAYAYDLRLMLAAGILCLIAFVSARTGTWGGLYWLDFGERPENFFPAAALLFAMPALPQHDRFAGFAALYRVFGLLTLFLPMLVLANWGRGSYLRLDHDLIEGAYQVLGFMGTAAAIWLGTRRQWPETVNTALTLFVVFLYTKFFDWWWQSMPKYLFFLVLGLTAILFLVVMRRLRRVQPVMQGGAA